MEWVGWAGLGWKVPGAELGWAGLGWVDNPETEVGLLENGTTEEMSFRMANSNHQTLFNSFLRVQGFGFCVLRPWRGQRT